MIEGVTQADNFTTIRKVTAEETNSWWKNVMGYDNPLEGWGKGGGIQFDLMGQRVGEFLNPRKLP